MNNPDYEEKWLIPFDVIESAISKDPDAIAFVINHYRNFIDCCSRRDFYNFYGGVTSSIDNEVRDEITINLISAITKFRKYQ